MFYDKDGNIYTHDDVEFNGVAFFSKEGKPVFIQPPENFTSKVSAQDFRDNIRTIMDKVNEQNDNRTDR